MLLEDVARTSAALSETSGRRAKVRLLAATLALLEPTEVSVAVAYLSGGLPQGTIGVGWAALRELPPRTTGAAALER
jgi:DNA ligase-1